MSTRLLRSLLALGLGLMNAVMGSAQTQTADTIYYGGDIVTINDAAPSAEALAVKDGKILAVGKKADVLTTKGDATQVVDLAGKTLLPGFIDGHSHFINSLTMASQANCFASPFGPGSTKEGIIDSLKRLRTDQNIPAGGFVVGYGYDDEAYPEGARPTAADLDADFPDHPVILVHRGMPPGTSSPPSTRSIATSSRRRT